ncbi:MAG TPA: hypothetical protein VH025_00895 [Solirubrobacteraceae bacterium]|jgi:hypothetical protein|nr:hypothetical protein [Solirubrobacteraceae bacterium]
MTEFLTNLKADLTDRRMLPFVAAAGLALFAALLYVVLAGGSGSSTPTAAAPHTASTPAGLATSAAPAETAVAETTSGVADQRKGAVRNPFTPLKGSTGATGTSGSTGVSGSSGSTGGSGVTGGSGGSESKSSEEATPAKPKKKHKKQTVYHVSILFGEVPAGETAALPEQLTPSENLKLLTALPSAKTPLLVYRGVTTSGKSATFTVVGEAILSGEGKCLPSESQCQAIDLVPNQTEQLQYLTSAGQTVIYELKLVSITKSTASAASVKTLLRRGKTRAMQRLLRRKHLFAIPFLHETAQAGVLAFAARPRAPRARIAHARHAR